MNEDPTLAGMVHFKQNGGTTSIGLYPGDIVHILENDIDEARDLVINETKYHCVFAVRFELAPGDTMDKRI